MLRSVMPIREPKGTNDKDIVKCVAGRCASGLMTSEREDGLNQCYATSYRPPSTATILESQVVEAEEEVIDMELHGTGHVGTGCWNVVVGKLCICTLDMTSTIAG